MSKALLIAPCPEGLVAKKTRKFHRRFPPLSLLITASLLRSHGWDVELHDLNANRGLSPEQTLNCAKTADMIILTTNPYADWQCPSYAIRSVLEFARHLPSERLVITGNHGSLYPGGMLKATGSTVVVRDEPEYAVLELAEVFQGKGDLSRIDGISYRDGDNIRHTGQRQPASMDDFPAPAYHLVNLHDYYYELLGGQFALLETSRGCPYSCSFCNRSMFQNRYRKRSVVPFLQELDDLVQIHGCRSLYIFDLEFTLDSKMVESVCRHLIDRKYAEDIGFRWTCQTRADSVTDDLLKLMKQSGCALIHFGVEAGNAEILSHTGKKISKEAIRKGVESAKQAGIQTAAFFMFGLPGETSAHYEETLRFALELSPTYTSFHPLLPIPGSPLFEAKYGKGPYWNDPLPADMTYFTPEQEHEISRFVRKAYLKYYLRPGYIAERIAQGNRMDYLKQLKLFIDFAFQK